METLGQITTAAIRTSDKRARVTGGTCITFLSSKNLTIGDYVNIVLNEGTHHFKVENIEISGKDLLIDAIEAGYWAHKFDNTESFDLRTLIGLDVTLVTDKEEKSRINEESCWC